LSSPPQPHELQLTPRFHRTCSALIDLSLPDGDIQQAQGSDPEPGTCSSASQPVLVQHLLR